MDELFQKASDIHVRSSPRSHSLHKFLTTLPLGQALNQAWRYDSEQSRHWLWLAFMELSDEWKRNTLINESSKLM